MVDVRLVLQLLVLRVRLPRMVRDERLSVALAAVDRDASGLSWDAATEALRVAEGIVRRSHVVRDTCLERALGRYAILRRTGRPVRFVMGVRKTPTGALYGHAWILVDGSPFGETVDPAMAVTFSHGAGEDS